MNLEALALPEADIFFAEDFLKDDEALVFMNELLWCVPWEQRDITIYGKVIPQPRLTAWFGDGDYTYSGVTSKANSEWPKPLAALRRRVEKAVGSGFNSCLLNHYRNGRDSIGMHSDDEPELGPDPLIASVSLGASREFDFKAKRSEVEASIDLTNGSLLIMAGATQRNYKHGIKKTPDALTRINLTFRNIV